MDRAMPGDSREFLRSHRAMESTSWQPVVGCFATILTAAQNFLASICPLIEILRSLVLPSTHSITEHTGISGRGYFYGLCVLCVSCIPHNVLWNLCYYNHHQGFNFPTTIKLQCYAKHKTWSTATVVARSAYVSACHCKNVWTDWGAIWGGDSRGPRNHLLERAITLQST